MLVRGVIFGSLGGMLGALFFKKNLPPSRQRRRRHRRLPAAVRAAAVAAVRARALSARGGRAACESGTSNLQVSRGGSVRSFNDVCRHWRTPRVEAARSVRSVRPRKVLTAEAMQPDEQVRPRVAGDQRSIAGEFGHAG
jgi:hypothetical protein